MNILRLKLIYYLFLFSEGRAIGAATVVHASGKVVPQCASNFRQSGSGFASKSWITGLLALPTAGFTYINVGCDIHYSIGHSLKSLVTKLMQI